MGRFTVLLILAGLFISVCASKVGGSYGHVKYGDTEVPKYAKNIKQNLRKQQESSNEKKDLSDTADGVTQPTFDNPPDDEAIADDEQLNDKNISIDSENPPNADDQEQPENTTGEGNQEDPNKNKDISDENDGELVIRGITAGDNFTPHELLPVTRKLIEKVDNPGEGNGIVSSAKSPEDLADVLFEAFFFGPRRIVTLEEKDIIDLDALQALAISGEEARRMYTPTQVTAPGNLLKMEDQIVKISPRTSKYLLLRKSESSKVSGRNKNKIYKFRNRKDKRMIKRRAPNTRQNLIKKLQKKRQLVLNPVRKNNKLNRTRATKGPAESKIKTKAKSPNNIARKNVKHDKTKAIKTSASTNNNKAVQRTKPLCRWSYKCTDPGEGMRTLRKSRKMLGVSPVDEEVEKILEARIMQLKAPVMREHSARIESLSQYFNNIIVAQFQSTTVAENRDNDNVVSASVIKDTSEQQSVQKNNKDRYFFFPGDGDNKLHLVDTLESVNVSVITEYACSSANNSYWLFTRANPNSAQILVIGDDKSVSNSNFDAGKETVFLSHGWKGDGNTKMNKLLTEAYLESGDVNVIVLDWSLVASNNYVEAVSAVPEVGRGLGRFICWLNNSFGLSFDRTQLVGFSLGGHLVGNAGRELLGQIKRITSLDPAGPLWSNDTNRIVPTDARYVEVIHTNTRMYGYSEPCGHSDHYPNGGLSQPGCWINSCSHARAYEYMAASIKLNHLLANKCETHENVKENRCNGKLHPMGNGDLNKKQSGIFRVNTGKDYPFEVNSE